MFSFRSTLVFAALASTLVFADPASHELRRLENGRRHHSVNILQRDSHLAKRFDNTRFTFFQVGQNACGSFDHDNDFIVALNTHQWEGGSHCYDQITVEYNGKTAKAQITDMCVECPYAAIDLSPGLFKFLVPGGLDQGQVFGSWVFGGGDPAPSTTPEAKPTTTTTQKPPPPSTTTTSTTSTTSKKKTSTSTTQTPTTTSTSTTSTSTTPTITSTTEAPSPTVTSLDTGNLNQFNLAVLQLVGLSNAVLESPDDA